jgi:hypothetical protein
MNHPRIDPTFATGFRELLVTQVASGRAARRRHWWLGAGFVGILAVAGAAGVATAELTRPPGAPIVAPMVPDTSVSATFTGPGTIELGPPPAGADAIEFTFTCLTAGTFVFEMGGSTSCTEAQTGPPPFDVPLMPHPIPDDHAFSVETSQEARWSISVSYVTVTETEWGVNANGQTYGALKVHPDGSAEEPDLQPVYASNGQRGYALTTDLNGAIADPDMPEFDTAEEAAAWVMAHEKDRFPVYESDGETIVGEFVIGQAPQLPPAE